MGFNFRFQKVLDFEYEKERSLKLRLASLIKEYINQELVLNDLKQQKEAAQKNLSSLYAMNNIIDGHSIVFNYQYIEGLNIDIGMQLVKINALEDDIERVWNELLEVSKRRRIWERLKERLKREYILELSKKEGEFLDEIGLFMYLRKKDKSIKGLRFG